MHATPDGYDKHRLTVYKCTLNTVLRQTVIF